MLADGARALLLIGGCGNGNGGSRGPSALYGVRPPRLPASYQAHLARRSWFVDHRDPGRESIQHLDLPCGVQGGFLHIQGRELWQLSAYLDFCRTPFLDGIASRTRWRVGCPRRLAACEIVLTLVPPGHAQDSEGWTSRSQSHEPLGHPGSLEGSRNASTVGHRITIWNRDRRVAAQPRSWLSGRARRPAG